MSEHARNSRAKARAAQFLPLLALALLAAPARADVPGVDLVQVHGITWSLICCLALTLALWPCVALLTRVGLGWSLAVALALGLPGPLLLLDLPWAWVVLAAVLVGVAAGKGRGLRWSWLGLAAGLAGLGLAKLAPAVDDKLPETRQPWHRTMCEDRLEEVGLALRSYAEDYDGRPPPGKTTEEVFPPLRDYMGGGDVFRCPGADGSYWSVAPHGESPPGAYVLAGPMPERLDALTAELARTSCLLTDDAPRHWRGGRRGRNCAFVDGHVEWRPEVALTREAAQPAAGHKEGE